MDIFETLPLVEGGAGIPIIVIIAALFYLLTNIDNNTKQQSPPLKKPPPPKKQTKRPTNESRHPPHGWTDEQTAKQAKPPANKGRHPPHGKWTDAQFEELENLRIKYFIDFPIDDE